LQRFRPGLVGATTLSLLVLFLDPVSLDLVDPAGNRVNYDLQTRTLTSTIPNGFVSVAGNGEVLVLPMGAGGYTLRVSNVPETSRGGFIIVGGGDEQVGPFTDALRTGAREFHFGKTAVTDAQVLNPLGLPEVDNNGVLVQVASLTFNPTN